MDENYTVIIFPEFVTLKKEVEKLRTEVSMLLLERDELRLVVCKNIESAYMLALGGIEYKAYELYCKVLRVKRKIDLIRAKKNRQEAILLSDIEAVLDEEFAEYGRRLDEQIAKMNKALDHSKGRPLSEGETKELKKLYRTIVKALHPDLHPEITPSEMQLFQNAVQASIIVDGPPGAGEGLGIAKVKASVYLPAFGYFKGVYNMGKFSVGIVCRIVFPFRKNLPGKTVPVTIEECLFFFVGKH